MLSWVQMKLKLETDAVDIVKEMILTARKGARLALIGDYFNYTNGFPIGAFMEKGQSMSGGQLWCQKYWHHLLSLIQSGDIDFTFLFSHRFRLNEIPAAYKAFAHHEDNCTKVIIKTDYGIQLEEQRGAAAGNKSGMNTMNQWGKLSHHTKPPTHATNIHLLHENAKGKDQILAHIGTSGGIASNMAMGTTNSSMGTSVAGSGLGAQSSQIGVGAVHQGKVQTSR